MGTDVERPPFVLKLGSFDTHSFKAALAEMAGVFFLQVFGSTVATGALANGILLAILTHAFLPLSGGLLNPAFTLAAFFTAHLSFARVILYTIGQVAGAALGALAVAGLLEAPIGDDAHARGPGCFGGLNPQLPNDQRIWGWEVLTTGFIALVFYLTILSPTAGMGLRPLNDPGNAMPGPWAVGLALFVAADAAGGATGQAISGGGGTSGGAFNPARVLGPAIVYGCGWRKKGGGVWLFMLAEYTGAIAAAMIYHFVVAQYIELARAAITSTGARASSEPSGPPASSQAPAAEPASGQLREPLLGGV